LKKQIHSEHAPPPGGYYSQGIHAGPFIFVSGQLPFAAGGQIEAETAAGQTRQALANVEMILAEAQASMDNLVSVTIYVSDIDLWPKVNEAYEVYLDDVSIPPARAVVPTQELHFGALVEISAIAYRE